MNKKVLAVGRTPALFKDIESLPSFSDHYELAEARDRSEAFGKLDGMIDAVLFVPTDESEQEARETLSALEDYCSPLFIPIFVSCETRRPLSWTAEYLPRDMEPSAIAERIKARLAVREENDRLAKANSLLGRENEKLRNIHFLTLEYATMIENDLMDRIKALAEAQPSEKTAEGSAALGVSGRESELLRAENDRLKLEIEKVNVILSAVVSHDSVIEDQLDEQLKETNELAHRDPLTRIFNRRKFNEELVRAYNAAQAGTCDLSLIMFDIDHFKEVNDRFGHDAGDEVLRAIARVVGEALPSRAVFARWGGEEFMILAPDTDLETASATAEALRLAIREARSEEVGQVTCSFGVVQVDKGEEPQSFLKRLDKSLYEAKESGRDCVRAGAANKGEHYDE